MDYGADTRYLRELLAYRGDGFDWRAREGEPNRFEHYRANIDGALIHFVHARRRDENATDRTLVYTPLPPRR